MKYTAGLVAIVLSHILATGAHAAAISDPAGDFLATLAASAPRAGDLDVLSSRVSIFNNTLILTATVNAPINTTPDSFYVWGLDRGLGASTSNFSSLGLPNIIFDSVIVIQNEGTGAVNDLTGGSPPQTLAPGSVTSSGNTITAVVPLSFLPSKGFATAQYTWNLWPRFGGAGVTGNAQIADFAPNSSMAPVDTVPEPSTMALLAGGLAGAIASRRRIRR